MSDKISKIPCVRCLIRDMDDETARQAVSSYQQTVTRPVSSEVYECRLTECLECKWLHMGTCRKCGMYAEARAYAIDSFCPIHFW